MEVSCTQAAVDVVTAQCAHELRGQMKFFQGAVGAGQATQRCRTVFGFDLLHAIGHIFQGCSPVHGMPMAVLFDHRLGQTVGAVQGLVAEAVAIGNPAFIDVFVFQRHDTHDLVVLDLNNQVGTRGVMRTDGFAATQFPGPGLVAERLAGQCPNRADVNHVAGQLGVHGFTDKGFDLGMLAPVGHAQLHAARNFLAKTNTPGAVDATAHLFHADEGSHIFVKDHALFFVVTGCTAAIANRQVLQLTFAALVADGAIQRVVDQQELHHRFLGFDGTL